MKLLYIAEVDINSGVHLGIIKKIVGQLKAFKKNNIEANLYCYKNGEPYLVKDLEELLVISPLQNSRFINRFKFRKSVSWIANNYHVVYVRLSVPDFLMIYSLSKISTLKILEIPTPLKNFKEEFKKDAKYIKFVKDVLYRLFIGKYLKTFDLIVEIENTKTTNSLDNSVFISNGIDMELFPLKKNQHNEKDLHLIGVANVHYWHGYDRVIRGMYDYYQLPRDRKVFFHIVGEGAEIPRLKAMVTSYNLNDYVIFHGSKVGKELDVIFDKCHLAVGSLGMHRNGLKYGSTLKVREYCARGIPFIIAYDDCDFTEDFEFLKKFPADESFVNIEEIISFYESIIRKHPNYPEKMREFAEKNLSWEAKMKPVIKKIQELLEGRKK
ncbi:glycosyltransferase family 4 protein [Thermoanaerobacter brockii subsp. lactiethylicus]